MKKFLVRVLCIFVFSKILRKKLRFVLGRGNRILIIENDGYERPVKFSELRRLKLKISVFQGKNNTIKFHKNFRNISADIFFTGSNNTVFIGNNVSGVYNIKFIGSDNKIVISDECHSNGCSINFFGGNNSSFVMGKRCLCSWDVQIFVTDGHPMFDKITGEKLNYNSSFNFSIGEHCWLGYGSIITKNANLADNVIVGAGAVVVKPVEKSFVAVAGNPAKIVKENIMFRF